LRAIRISSKIEGMGRISLKYRGNQGVFPEILDIGTNSVNSWKIRNFMFNQGKLGKKNDFLN